MPCYDPETHERPIRLEAKVHALTELLCSTCQRLEAIDDNLIKADEKLNLWWIKHKSHDAKVAAAQLKKDTFGFQSLNAEEASLLWFKNDISAKD